MRFWLPMSVVLTVFTGFILVTLTCTLPFDFVPLGK
jgi:hypothetical protein